MRITHLGGDIWMVDGCGLRAVYDANGTCRDGTDCEAELKEGPFAFQAKRP